MSILKQSRLYILKQAFARRLLSDVKRKKKTVKMYAKGYVIRPILKRKSINDAFHDVN